MSQCTSLPYQSYGQYWLDEEGCECGPFVIEPVSSDDSNKDVTVRELKLSYEPQVRPNSQYFHTCSISTAFHFSWLPQVREHILFKRRVKSHGILKLGQRKLQINKQIIWKIFVREFWNFQFVTALYSDVTVGNWTEHQMYKYVWDCTLWFEGWISWLTGAANHIPVGSKWHWNC